MRLKHLELHCFRNCDHIRLTPCDGLNIIHGPNAQGKTNILEAISILTSFDSFRSVTLRDLIQIDSEKSTISCDVLSQDLLKHVEIALKEGQRLVSIDGATARGGRELAQHVRSISFVGDDLRLITGSPARRRRFLDKAIASLTPDYPELLREYGRALAQKSALLATSGHAGLLDVWNDRLASLGARVTAARVRFVRHVAAPVEEHFRAISGTGLEVRLEYSCGVPTEDPRISTLEAELRRALDAARREEHARRATLVGPHRDDLGVRLMGQVASRFASQGQLRMLAMALKLAELWSVAEHVGIAPIFLVDDVSTELDEQRNRCLMDTLNQTGCQVFVTTTALANVPTAGWGDCEEFPVRAGSILV